MHAAMGAPGAPYPGGPTPRPVLDKSVLPKIKALVMFGDPGFKGVSGGVLTGGAGQFSAELYEKLRENCAFEDPVSDLPGIYGKDNAHAI
jgi:hypothetical protein